MPYSPFTSGEQLTATALNKRMRELDQSIAGGGSLGGVRAQMESTIANAGSTVVVTWCSNEYDDSDYHYTPADGLGDRTRFTVDQTARYLITVSMPYETGTSAGLIGLYIRKNATDKIAKTAQYTPGSTHDTINFSCIVELETDDYIDIAIENDTSHTISIGVISGTGLTETIIATICLEKLLIIAAVGNGASDDCS